MERIIISKLKKVYKQPPISFLMLNHHLRRKKIGRELRPNYSTSEDDVQGCIQAILEKIPVHNSTKHRTEILRTIKQMTCEVNYKKRKKYILPSITQSSSNKNIIPQRNFSKKKEKKQEQKIKHNLNKMRSDASKSIVAHQKVFVEFRSIVEI